MQDELLSANMIGYSEAVRSGLYAKRTGLTGKYDNVRRFWEDEVTRLFLYPYIRKLIEQSQSEKEPLRIMDLGCGSADGFELLTGIRRENTTLAEHETELIPPELLGIYKGVDLNQDLLDQGQAIYGSDPRIRFEKADFTDGLPCNSTDAPYHLYFSSFGTTSHHLSDDTLVRLLSEIALKTIDRCLVICDWLGRYSYEWQELWSADVEETQVMDYVVSYIYEKEERDQRRDQLQHLRLRLMSRPEIDAVLKSAREVSGASIRPLLFFDRSVLSGRHMDTGDYNSQAQPIREVLNSLHEPYVRTDLTSLIVRSNRKDGFDSENQYFDSFTTSWNTLVQFVFDLLESSSRRKSPYQEDSNRLQTLYPVPLARQMKKMSYLVETLEQFDTELPRESILEPQLGYALRQLEMDLQSGRGNAHGLVGVFEIDNT